MKLYLGNFYRHLAIFTGHTVQYEEQIKWLLPWMTWLFLMQNNPDFFALMRHVYFFKWANPGLFIVYFWSFQTIFTTNQYEKMSECPSNIRHRDSIPRPFEHASSPITTRPILLVRFLQKRSFCFTKAVKFNVSSIFIFTKSF